MRARIALLAVALAAGHASADKLDDAYAKTDHAYQRYSSLRDQYATLYARWQAAYKPLIDHYPVEQAAYKNMTAACGGAGRGTPGCSQATLAWAAAVKDRQSLEYKAGELDPRHEADGKALAARQGELQAAKTEFDRAFDQAKAMFADARAHAHSQPERDKIDEKLAARDTKQRDSFAATRGAAADRANPSGGGGNNGSSGGSSRTNGYDPTGTVNSTISNW